MMKKNEDGMYEVHCDAEDGVLSVTPGEHVLGSMMTTELATEPRSQAEIDLVADTFFGLWQFDPTLINNPSPERAVNSSILQWFMDTPEFHQTRDDTRGSLFGSALSAGIMWESIMRSDKLREALDKQRRAEESAENVQELLKQVSDNMSDEDMQALMEMLKEEQEKGKAASQQAVESIEKMKSDALQSGMVAHIAEKAGEKTREANALVRGLGVEPGDITAEDAQEVMKLAKQAQTSELSEILGRLRGVAMNAIEKAHVNNTSVNIEASMTRRFDKLFPTQRVQLSQQAPPYVRAINTMRLVAGGGLLGWRAKTEAKRRGAFVGMLDKSGSMYSGRLTAGQAIVMSIASSLKQDDTIVERDYALCYFDSRADMGCITSNDDWKAHIAWAGVRASGGTNFDDAFRRAMQELTEMKARGIDGADLLFVTDGECWLSDEMREEWRKFSDEVGTRLIVVQVSEQSTWGQSLFDMADVYMRISHDEMVNNPDGIVAKLTTEIVKGDIESL